MKRNALLYVLVLIVICGVVLGSEAVKENVPADSAGKIQIPIEVRGVFPQMTVIAKGVGSDSEAGIGALIPWAEKLWAIGYVSHIKGQGLYIFRADIVTSRQPGA